MLVVNARVSFKNSNFDLSTRSTVQLGHVISWRPKKSSQLFSVMFFSAKAPTATGSKPVNPDVQKPSYQVKQLNYLLFVTRHSSLLGALKNFDGSPSYCTFVLMMILFRLDLRFKKCHCDLLVACSRWDLCYLLGTLETIFKGLRHRNDLSILKSNGTDFSTRMVMNLMMSSTKNSSVSSC